MESVYFSKDQLLEAVGKLVSVCERAGSGLPHFFHIRFDGMGKEVSLSASNMSRRAKVLLKATNTHNPFCIGVPGLQLYSLLQSIADKDIKFEITDHLTIKLKNGASYTLPILFSDSFPSQDEPNNAEWVEVDLDSMFGAMGHVLYCSDKESERAYAKAVNFIKEGFFCTNGFRLSFIPYTGFSLKSPIMIPKEGMEAFINLFRGESGKGFLIIDDNKIHFSRGGTYAATNLYAGSVPNIWSVIPQGAFSAVRLKKAELLPVLKRMLTFSKFVVKTIPALELTFNPDGNMYMDFKSLEHKNSAKESLKCEYSGPVTSIACNLSYVHDAVKSVRSDDVIVEVRGEGFPMLITDEKGVHKNVIVPIRKS